MSLFDNAPVIEAPKAAETKKKSLVLAGLQEYAELDAAIKALDALKSTIRTNVEKLAFESFLTTGKELGKCPESFTGLDGNASASVELRKRGTNSALSDAEVKALQEAGFTPKKEVAQQAMFGINPKYSTNKDVLAKIEAALGPVLPPEVMADLIVKQNEKSKWVVDEGTVASVFAKLKADPAKDYSEMVRSVTTFALKPKLEVTDLKVIMKNVAELVAD